jgi:transcriptional regulator with XRE-family HTH domain
MMIAERLRAMREGKDLTQDDVEKRTGLRRVYVSRVENGHVVPSLETLEKFARALEVPMYQLFYEAEEPTALPLPKGKTAQDGLWGASGKEARLLSRFRRYLSLTDQRGRNLLLVMARRMARRKHTRSRSHTRS